jgi:hypothetical protein
MRLIMTQFALVKTSKTNPNLKPIDEIRDDFLLGIVAKIFPDSSCGRISLFDVDGKDIDSLMLDAQKRVIESSRFEKTVLHGIIDNVARAADELVLWYGSDYEDLECIYDVPTLLSKLEEAVSDSSCELYIHYKKSK